MGYIIINTIAISNGTPGIEDPSSWTGTYFQGVPITLTTIPQSGYRFLRWEGIQGIDPTMETLTITLENDLSLKAVFEVADD